MTNTGEQQQQLASFSHSLPALARMGSHSLPAVARTGSHSWRSGRSSPPDVTSFFSHNKHNRCIYSRKQGNMNWFFCYWHIFMQYINLQISTTQLKTTVVEYVTNRLSTHLQLNCVMLGQTVRFTKPQTKSESL